MDLRDFYKEHYRLEITRKQELTNALTLPFGVLSLLVGGVLVVANKIDYPLELFEISELGTIVLASICLNPAPEPTL